MIPGHCKNISVREVDFSLTANNIGEHIKDKKAYTRTEFIILRNGDQFAVVRVSKKNGVDLFRPIIEHEILSLPEETVFVIDESVDVMNASQLARLAEENFGKTVVVQGMFNHVSFARSGNAIEVSVLDVVPPSPSKLSVLVEKALDSYLSEFPIVPSYQEIDINDLANRARSKAIVFPCKASGLISDKETYFLDQTPALPDDITLIGCDLSQRIFRSLYRRDARRITMCPRDLAPKDGRKRIVKCCLVKEGFEVDGDLAVVPWGATVKETSDALKVLLGLDHAT